MMTHTPTPNDVATAPRIYTGDVVQIKPGAACPHSYHGIVAVVTAVISKRDIEVMVRSPLGTTFTQRLQYPDDCVRIGACQWNYEA